MQRICFIFEKGNPHVNYAEDKLSMNEQVDKAAIDCNTLECVSTMSSTYLQALKLFADRNGVLDQWKFIIKHADGTDEDVTNNTEKAFAMMASAIDRLFMIGWDNDDYTALQESLKKDAEI